MNIVSVFLKYGYGIKDRGDSLEKLVFLPALQGKSILVTPFWLEENGYPEDKISLQKKILNFVYQKKPDIVFFMLMSNEVTVETIETLSKDFITINWFCDDQWRFNSFTKYIAPILTYSITVDKYSLQKYRDIGCENVILSQWASFEYVDDIDFSNVEYNYDISFVGGRNQTREWYIHELEKYGYKIHCFGYGWDNGMVSYEEMKNIFSTSKINLNLSNSRIYDLRFRRYLISSFFRKISKFKFKSYLEALKNIKRYITNRNDPKKYEQIKMRNFEIPGCGGFQLGHHAPSIEDYFVYGKEIAVFSNIDELKLQVEYYLSNEGEREKIRAAGYSRAKNHTYKERFEEIFRNIIA